MSKPSKRTTDPKEFPVEVCMLFEQAAFEPVRVPKLPDSFTSQAEAFGHKMTYARYRAQMRDSPQCPPAFASLLRQIQVSAELQDAHGWHFLVKPLDNRTIAVARQVVGEATQEQHEKFWETYK